MILKQKNPPNPFADYGKIITGERFIGRKYAIQAIHNRVLRESFGNIAIMGLPRIGKSSLAWQALLNRKEQLLIDSRIIILRINVGEIDNSKDFFDFLVQKTFFELTDIFDSEKSKKLEIIIEKISTARQGVEKNNYITRYFRQIKNSGYRLVFILDEFDNVSEFFQLSDFQFLRELSINPDYKICLVTISRRTIQELEPENGVISNFYGVFTDLRLGMFTDEDIDEYWAKLEEYNIELKKEYCSKVMYLVGTHPYLIDLVNYHVFNLINEKGNSFINNVINEIEHELKLTLFTNFESSLSLIKKENLYNKAFQLVLGPIYDVTSIDEEKLIKYQFIKTITKEAKDKLLGKSVGLITSLGFSYICFSEYFTEYLNLKFYETNFWPIWKELEKGVREIIKYFLTDKFGNCWEVNYVQHNKDSQSHLDAMKRLQLLRQDSINKFGILASNHLIDYTLTRDMYDHFLSPNWDWFKSIFDSDNKKDWGKKFNMLSNIRNPIAHNNNEFISDETLLEARIYCEQILAKINQWKVNFDKLDIS